MILEIAAGIVLAFVILALWREILALGAILVVLGIVLVVGGLVIAGIYWLATEHEIPQKNYVPPPRDALDVWMIQTETTLIIIVLTYVALVAVYVIDQLRKPKTVVEGKQTTQPPEKEVRGTLRSELDKAISDEKARIKTILNEGEAKLARSVKAMGPVIAALESLKAEVGEVEGLEITPSQHGYSATVRLKSSWSERSLEISPNSDNSKFEIKEFDSSLDSDDGEKYRSCATCEDVMKFVISAVGKHIASKQVLSERKK